MPKTIPELAESLVISWIAQETPAPASLTGLLARYRDLTIFADQADDPEPFYAKCNDIYDRLAESAKTVLLVNAKAEAQLRRIQRRNEERWTYSQKCDHAIAQWRANR